MSKSSTRTRSSSRSHPRYWARYTPTAEHRFTPGIPARDLTEDEVVHWGIEALTNAKCYELVEVAPDDQDDDQGAKET